MTTALTISEAAEQLAVRFEQPSSATSVAKARGKKWLSLEDAGAELAERFGAPAKARPKTSAASVKDAGATIANGTDVSSDNKVDLQRVASARAKREYATAVAGKLNDELNTICERALRHFEGTDEQTRANSAEFWAVHRHIEQLMANRDRACAEETSAWNEQCHEEDDAFLAERPEWSGEDSERVMSWLVSLGATQAELHVLWVSPWPLNLDGPIATGVAAAAGFASIADALASVDVDPDSPVLIRDHRMQTLIARAHDAQRQDQAAA